MGYGGFHTPKRGPDGRFARKYARRYRGAARTHQALRMHPRFAFPDLPPADNRDALIEFIMESVARFVSPPKVPGESEEFACEDIAEAIRTMLKPEIMRILKDAETS